MGGGLLKSGVILLYRKLFLAEGTGDFRGGTLGLGNLDPRHAALRLRLHTTDAMNAGGTETGQQLTYQTRPSYRHKWVLLVSRASRLGRDDIFERGGGGCSSAGGC